MSYRTLYKFFNKTAIKVQVGIALSLPQIQIYSQRTYRRAQEGNVHLREMESKSPIALFTFNRPEHTAEVIEALAQARSVEEREIHVFCDGPRSESDASEVQRTRDVLQKQKLLKLQLHPSEKNKGLARSIIDGLNEMFKSHEKVIVLEDDIVVSPGFLDYMDDAFARYKEEERVMHISGYMFPLKSELPETFFYNTASCWGWGTWKRAWLHFEENCEEFYTQLKTSDSLRYDFDIDGSADFYHQLEGNIQGRLNTWAVKWYVAIFKAGGLSLHPGKSLCRNIGMDGSGVHQDCNQGYEVELSQETSVRKIPLEELPGIRKDMSRFYAKLNQRPSGWKKWKARFQHLKKKLHG